MIWADKSNVIIVLFILITRGIHDYTSKLIGSNCFSVKSIYKNCVPILIIHLAIVTCIRNWGYKIKKMKRASGC